ncbi:aspartyl protease family protein [Pleionea sp. CnH1-48]|uniref:aspartyl protease family protein n=1 Tax=Pleionea sp. CnH1-48 TaxID=2954494 RepID=UPI0020980F29|nr:aspartyl protease family protein [Pleionea sp. CnH1-48]MCO7225358.1 aspartyl protease family protein [Pleionea sp. CnH1-48]
MKQIILTLIAIMTLSSCSVVNYMRMKNANNGIEPILPTSDSRHFEQSMQAFYIGEKPYIQVKINGKEELLFLIDTGASFTILFDTEKVSKLQLERGFSLEIGGWGEGESSPAYQTLLKSVSFGGVGFEDVKVAYIPISTTQYYLTPDEAIYDGVLGHDLLRHFNWMFDKEASKISIANASFSSNSNDVKIPFDVSFSKLKMPVTMHIGGRDFEQQVSIDTGSRHYFKFNTEYVKNRDIQLPDVAIQASDFGLSGEAKHMRIRLPGLSLGNLRLEGVKTNVIKADDEDDYWVIGSALMNQFITIIDYQNNIMTFRPYEKVSFSSRYNLAGLDLRKLKNDMLVVRQVYPDLIANQQGFKVGSVITSINKVDAREITEQEWLEMVSIPNTFEFCFKHLPCTSITTKHIEGYSTNSQIKR